jgi:RNA polymerase sigma-70 factor (ECF subfamily)
MLSDFEGGSVRAWLFAIARRAAADHRKRAYHRREIACAEPNDHSVPPDQEETVARREQRQLLEQVLASLDEGKRDVFTLFELEDMPMAKVAEAVGCPVKTAYARLYAARKIITSAFSSPNR